ncbi:hypothetical protein [Streptomyces sp. CBMA156]|uniref:hypothetical protein n=1 Tax=Streptomyces sp. CBMA156 TaxID=1930280 RepID=UPI001661FF9E|nr:hypothetical protein [Streptomyces sp. CBMA156]MBD0673105.1 hypothetical protein [Streptomyces sp. CBMA156]
MDDVITTGLSALVTLMVNAGWSTIRDRVRGILSRHRAVEQVEEDTELEQLRESLRLPGGEEGFSDQDRQRVLGLWRIGDAAPDLQELAAQLSAGPLNSTSIVNNGKMVNHSGSGDQHITF